jgi:hypothetical protein
MELVPNNKCNYCNINPNSHSFKQVKNSLIPPSLKLSYTSFFPFREERCDNETFEIALGCKRILDPTVSGEYVIFYSKVATAELYNNTESILHHFNKELECVREWCWIFDCKDMDFKHYIQFNLIKELAKLIELHGGLRRIYLLEPSWLIHMSIKCANLFMTLPEIIISTDSSSYRLH